MHLADRIIEGTAWIRLKDESRLRLSNAINYGNGKMCS